MRGRPQVGLVAVLALVLAACGPPAAHAPAGGPVAAPAGTAPVSLSCPTTRPPDPRFVPPAPYPRRPPPLYGDVVWYGSDRLWTWLPVDGTWAMAGPAGGAQSDKSFWWRKGYDWQTETTPGLRVTGRRLDAAAPAVTTSDATNGFRHDIGAFMLVGLELPAGGCWELTGRYGGQALRLVVRVT